MRNLVTALAAAALALPATALGATVSADGAGVLYRAAQGEANDVDVVVEREVIVRDAGAVLQAGDGCTASTANEVVCRVTGLRFSVELDVELGDGEDGFSAVCRSQCSAVVSGGSGNDRILGSEFVDRLSGDAGDDVLDGRAGETCGRFSCSGDGLLGGDGRDRLDGGDGPDHLDGGLAADDLRGGAGWDVASYSTRDAPVVVDNDGIADDGATGEGDNVGRDIEGIVGGRGPDTLIGGDGDDYLDGYFGHDALRGGRGDDLLIGWNGNDDLSGGRGDDALLGGAGSDVLRGRGGADLLVGEQGRDRLLGGAGDDVLRAADRAPDRLRGGPGRDRASFDRGLDDVLGVERVIRPRLGDVDRGRRGGRQGRSSGG